MSMTISESTSTRLAAAASAKQQATQAASPLDASTAALKKADARVQKQLASTVASISGLGKFKAAVSQAQLSARDLAGIKDSSTGEAVKKTLTAFASSFNAIVAETRSVAADASGTARISRGMTRTMNADLSRIQDLRAMGFTSAPDGSMKIDMAKFEAAHKANPKGVQDTLAKLGRLVEKTAEKELASEGRIANSLAALNGHSNSLKQQQSALLNVSQLFAQQGKNTGFFGTLMSAYSSAS